MTGWRDLWFDVFHRWRWQRGTNRVWFAVDRWQQRKWREQMQAQYELARNAWWNATTSPKPVSRTATEELVKAMNEMWTKLKHAQPGTPPP